LGFKTQRCEDAESKIEDEDENEDDVEKNLEQEETEITERERRPGTFNI
jgi:hypothetical protein